MLQFIKNEKKVLWINTLPVRNLSIKRVGKSTFWKKLKNKFVTHIKILRFPLRGVAVFSPLYIPNVENERIIKINNCLVKYQINILKAFFNIKDYIIWTSGEPNADYVANYSNSTMLIYQAGDFLPDLRDITNTLREKLLKKTSDICNKADIIFAASFKIKKKIENIISNKEKVIYLPHGVNYKHFAINHKIDEKISNIRKPIAGYYGSLSNANDKEVFIELAKNGFSVVVIGKISGDYSKCFKYKNIHFLGPVSYQKLPSYAQYFDVCLLNWKMAEWIQNCFPIKTLEYLAMAKPIVSVRIPEIKKRFGELIYFADTPEEFVKKCRMAINEDNDFLRVMRKEAVKNETWGNRFVTIRKALEDI
jgi:glycosyltransferase involved in cell wall biosynthesis